MGGSEEEGTEEMIITIEMYQLQIFTIVLIIVGIVFTYVNLRFTNKIVGILDRLIKIGERIERKL